MSWCGRGTRERKSKKRNDSVRVSVREDKMGSLNTVLTMQVGVYM